MITASALSDECHVVVDKMMTPDVHCAVMAIVTTMDKINHNIPYILRSSSVHNLVDTGRRCGLVVVVPGSVTLCQMNL